MGADYSLLSNREKALVVGALEGGIPHSEDAEGNRGPSGFPTLPCPRIRFSKRIGFPCSRRSGGPRRGRIPPCRQIGDRFFLRFLVYGFSGASFCGFPLLELQIIADPNHHHRPRWVSKLFAGTHLT